MSESFSEMLDRYLEERDLSHRSFAKIAGTTQGTVSQVLKGTRTPPVKQLAAWAKALDLSGEESARFIELGMSAKAAGKKDIAPYVAELEERYDQIRSGMLPVLRQLRKKGIKVPDSLLEALELSRKDLDSPE